MWHLHQPFRDSSALNRSQKLGLSASSAAHLLVSVGGGDVSNPQLGRSDDLGGAPQMPVLHVAVPGATRQK